MSIISRTFLSILVGLVIVITAPVQQADANPRYAALVVDAKTGKALFSRYADAQRYPASLTKMMTLYVLFEEIEAGRLSLNSKLKVSAHAAARPPTKIGVKAGGTIRAETAIRALAVRSANDVAVVIAENISGSESKFAQRMTRTARAIGMKSTTFRNASGLPNSKQVTTARDMALLGRALKDRYPKYFKYFSTRSFTYGGRTYRNTNRLLGAVNGVNGIKTGYTKASGFNLVTSIERDGRDVVAVVMGGRTGASRNAHMIDLIKTHAKRASRGKRTAPLLVAGTGYIPPVPPMPKSRPIIAAAAPAQFTPVPASAAVNTKDVAPSAPAPLAPAPVKTASAAATTPGLPRPAPAAPKPAPVTTAVVAAPEPVAPAPTAATPTSAPAEIAAVATPEPAAPAPIVAAPTSAPVETAAVATPEPAAPAPIAAKPDTAQINVASGGSASETQTKSQARVQVAKPPVARLVKTTKIVLGGEPDQPVIQQVATNSPADSDSENRGNLPSTNLTAAATASHKDLIAARIFAANEVAELAYMGEPQKAETIAQLARMSVGKAAEAQTSPVEPVPTSKPQAAEYQQAEAPAPSIERRQVSPPGWHIQIGAMPTEDDALELIASARSKASDIVASVDPFTMEIDKNGTKLYRARFAGFSDKHEARAACKSLKKRSFECLAVPN